MCGDADRVIDEMTDEIADLQAFSLSVVRELTEAVGLLVDYARIYPNNSGRTLRFLMKFKSKPKDG